ncbi:peptide MFS transporter [Plebeiibacterium marinum]|uniref:Peptide MFS transporter n=1 Tax=Plebeiibacterium marinum TaxID=2992111 RepID=A0AAE3SJE2_9BACT|nr:peptide MFS transporter [Plebeiobacterium marinum]MCW3805374.1 peptide MFS transporter [Plebeiobacterium marinum]
MVKEKTFLGHPKALFTLSATEMWERFNYYGMRALLIVFLTGNLASGGFGMDTDSALIIYGIFTSLVYITPILGGILADKFLGQRKTIYIGALTMAIGQVLLAYSAIVSGHNIGLKENVFYMGLGILIFGNGFFKPNISTLVGELYDANDQRRDGAFTIFYMGINVGAMLGPFVTGWLVENDLFGKWQYGFFAAALGMIIGFLWFYLSRSELGTAGMPPKYKGQKSKLTAKDNIDVLVYVVAIVVMVVGGVLLGKLVPATTRNVFVYGVLILGALYLLQDIIRNTKGKTEWSRVGVILVLVVFNIVFWSGYEQAGGLFNLFARDNLDRTIGGWTIPTAWFQMVSAISIVVFAPVFSVLWVRLDAVKLNPNTPLKFAWGIVLLSLGFVVMAYANDLTQKGSVLINPMWLITVFVIHTWGELCLSPIGLSMITKLSPVKIVSTMMGVWMGSIAAGNLFASQMKAISHSIGASLGREVPVFWFIAIETAFAAVILFLISPWLKKMMKGLK